MRDDAVDADGAEHERRAVSTATSVTTCPTGPTARSNTFRIVVTSWTASCRLSRSIVCRAAWTRAATFARSVVRTTIDICV